MGIIIAIVLIAGASLGSARHEGVLDKGADTTYADTVAFERHAAELSAQYAREKQEKINLQNHQKDKNNPVPESERQDSI